MATISFIGRQIVILEPFSCFKCDYAMIFKFRHYRLMVFCQHPISIQTLHTFSFPMNLCLQQKPQPINQQTPSTAFIELNIHAIHLQKTYLDRYVLVDDFCVLIYIMISRPGRMKMSGEEQRNLFKADRNSIIQPKYCVAFIHRLATNLQQKLI